MSETLYRKVQAGKSVRYLPVAERESVSAWPKGHHLVSCSPGHRLTQYRVEPDSVSLLAALTMHRDDVVKAIAEAFKYTPEEDSARSRKAIEAYYAAGGKEGDRLRSESAAGIFDILVNAVLAKAVLNDAHKRGSNDE